MALRDFIVEEIRRRGPIPFSRFMELCLYGAPEQGIAGYYMRSQEQFGKAGDFYTSSDVHAVFGRLLARQFQQMWQVLGRPARLELIELGPGRGLFAQDVLDWTGRKFPELAWALRTTLVEASPGLRQRLQERFSERIAGGKVRVLEALDELALAENDFAENFIVFGNEFFDALPVEVVSPEGEVHVSERAGALSETVLPARPQTLEFLERYSVQPESGERVEAAPAAVEVTKRIGAALRGRGFCVFIDYGYTRAEQLAGRHRGTLKIFRQHRMEANPYASPGEQDITADVNFTALAAAATSAGLQPLALLTQAQFLMGIGEENQFADAFEQCRLPQEKAKVALQLKHLVTPAGMGESFHVLVLGKDVGEEKAVQLEGLKFRRGAGF